MEFIQLKITNFLTIGESDWIKLSGRGLNIIQGVNGDDTSADSNGAGKSSLPDALAWALYGTTARGEAGDAVVNNTAKKGTAVVLVFRDGETVYEVQRYRKHATGKNSVKLFVYVHPATRLIGVDGLAERTSVTAELTKGTDRETDAEIERILGCSYEVFCAAIYAGQEQMPDLPAMTDKQLKLLLEQAAGVERLAAAYAVARGKATEQDNELNRLVNARTLQLGNVNTMRLKIDSVKATEEKFEEIRKEEITQADARIVAAETTFKGLVAAIKAIDGPALIARRDALTASLTGHRAAVEAAANHRKSQIAPLDRLIATSEHQVARSAGELTELHRRHANVRDELAKPCDACGKPHTEDEIDELRAHLAKLVDAKQGEHDANRALMVARKGTLATAKNAQEALEAAVPDVSAINTELAALNAKILNLNSEKSKARETRQSIDNERLRRAGLAGAANPNTALIVALTEQVDEGERAIAELDEKIERAQGRLQVLKDVATVFGPAGVRAHILDTVTPFLNERTAEYLSVLSDGHISAVWTTLTRTKAGELKEKFTIDVENDAGAKSFKGLSGGEKRKVRLATMLALQDLVASRASKPINIWCGDEIDDALDAAGLERLMTILETKARERGTVIVISHNQLSDWCDQVTTVTKSGGYSTVEGALCE